MNNESISGKTYFMTLSIECFALTSLIFPSILVGFGGEHGLVLLLLSSFFLFFKTWFFLKCLKGREESPDFLLNEGKKGWVHWCMGSFYGIRFFIHGLFVSLLFASLIKEVLLPGKGILYVLLPFYFLVYISAGKTIKVRGRIMEVLFPCIFLPLFLVLFLALFQLDYAFLAEQIRQFSWNRMQSGMQMDVPSLLYGIYGSLLFYEPVEFLFFLLPDTNPGERKKGEEMWKRKKKITYSVCIFVILLNIMMYLAAIGMFGTVRTGEKLWSALYIMQSVRLPGRFVERLDLLFLIFWIFSMFALFSAYLSYGSSMVCEKEKTGKKKWILVGTLILLLAFTLGIENTENYFPFFISYKMWVDFPLSILLPLVLYGKWDKKVVKKGSKGAFLAILCLLFLSGCSGNGDIEDTNYVMTLAVEPGEKKAYQVIYEIADVSSSGKDEAGGKGKMILYEADTLKEAAGMDRFMDDKKLNFGHLKAILINQSLMEGQWKYGGGDSLFEELKSMTEIAGTTLLFFTEEEGVKLIKAGEEKAPSFGEYAENIMSNQQKTAGKEDTISLFLRDYSENRRKRNLYVFRLENDVPVLEKQLFYREGILAKEEQDILRFHVRASSDKGFDQAKKEAVKNQILPKIQSLLAFTSSKEQCVTQIETALPKIEKWAKEACKKENYLCDVKAYLCREEFPAKCYGKVFLPAGTYDALRIDLGKGQGGNWWCMLYPSLCMTEGVVEQREENRENEEEAYAVQRDGKKYYIKWKIADILKGIFGKKSS